MIRTVLSRRSVSRHGLPVLAAACFSCAFATPAVDGDNFRGPAGDGISPEQGLTPWEPAGPRQIWRTPLTSGFSTFTVHGNQVFTQVRKMVNGSNREVCATLDGLTGQALWTAVIDASRYDEGGDEHTPLLCSKTRTQFIAYAGDRKILECPSLGPPFKGKAGWLAELNYGYIAVGGNVGLIDGSVAWKNTSQMKYYHGSRLWDDNGCYASW